jgi:hypothetical protein
LALNHITKQATNQVEAMTTLAFAGAGVLQKLLPEGRSCSGREATQLSGSRPAQD